MSNHINLRKICIFQFVGGGRDGQQIRSDSSEEANAFWALTWNGTVGRRFDVALPNGPSCQRYQVASKDETSGEITVECHYVGD
jgi:hypothetical protein